MIAIIETDKRGYEDADDTPDDTSAYKGSGNCSEGAAYVEEAAIEEDDGDFDARAGYCEEDTV